MQNCCDLQWQVIGQKIGDRNVSETLVRSKPTGKERHFKPEELIVSKTDLKGRITYANEVFLRLSDYREKEVLGQPHSIIRHPDMPRCVFKLLWDEIAAGHEIFAYVVNMSKNGDHYWVYAHITPSLDAKLRQIEESTANRKDGMIAAGKALAQKLSDAGLAYDKFIQSL